MIYLKTCIPLYLTISCANKKLNLLDDQRDVHFIIINLFFYYCLFFTMFYFTAKNIYSLDCEICHHKNNRYNKCSIKNILYIYINISGKNKIQINTVKHVGQNYIDSNKYLEVFSS